MAIAYDCKESRSSSSKSGSGSHSGSKASSEGGKMNFRFQAPTADKKQGPAFNKFVNSEWILID
jgi:hypothetical protein